MARPTKRTLPARDRIIQAIRLGATLRLAAQAGGMSYDALNDWMNKDSQFNQDCKDAEAARAETALRAIQRAAASGQWQAAAWFMERRYPAEYGRTIQEHAGATTLRVEYVNNWRESAGSSGDESEAQG